MQHDVHPHFVAAIGRNLQYWTEQAKVGDDAEIRRLLPFHDDIVQAAQFAVAIPAIQLDTVTLFERYFNLIERSNLEHVWLPILEVLLASEAVRLHSQIHTALQWREAALLRLNGQFKKAVTALNRLLATNSERQLRGRILLDLSLCNRGLLQFPEAEAFARQAFEHFVNADDAKWQASALLDMGLIATERGNYDDARTFLENALQLELTRTDTQDATRIVRVLNNLGHLKNLCQEPYQAMRYCFEALEYFDDVKNVGDVVSVLINLANSYLALDQYPKAVSTLRDAEERMEGHERFHYLRALVELNMGAAYFGLERWHASMRYSEQAAANWRSLSSPVLLARTLINIGDVQLKLSEPEEAQNVYREAMDLVEPLAADVPFAASLFDIVSEKLQ